MKTFILGIVTAFSMALTADANVVSTNVVGCVNIELPANFQMIGVNWDGIGNRADKSGTLEDILGTKGFTPASSWGFPRNADQLFIWNGAGYDIYALHWSGRWLEINDGNWWSDNPESPYVRIRSGDAVWVRKLAEGTITISGQAVTEAEGIGLPVGFTMLSYPYTASVRLDDLGFDHGMGATPASPFDFTGNADQLFIWNGTGYDIYALHWSGRWLEINDGNWWSDNPPSNEIEIPLGGAFWYKALNAFEYTPSAPYSL